MKAGRALCVAAAIFFVLAWCTSAQVPRDPTPIVAKTALGSSLRSNPATYSVDGKQYVFVTAGTTYFAFALP